MIPRLRALLVHGLLDAALWGARPAVLLWAAWGLAMAAWNRAATSPPNDTPNSPA